MRLAAPNLHYIAGREVWWRGREKMGRKKEMKRGKKIIQPH